MKMTQRHYQELKQSLESTMRSFPDATHEAYLKLGLTSTQFRWDMLHASKFCLRTLHSYLNDAHIDTALRKITNTY